MTLAELVALRSSLYALERESGVGDAHREASAQVLSAAPGWRLTANQARRGLLTCAALSPDGRYLAMGSDIGQDHRDGGAMSIWEVASGRCVNVLDPIGGGFGYARHPDQSRRMRWHPSGQVIGAVFDTNVVGAFEPFSTFDHPRFMGAAEGWDSGPAWCWNVDGSRFAIGLPATDDVVDDSSEVPILLGDYPERPGTRWAAVSDPQRAAGRSGEVDPFANRRPLRLDWSNDGTRIIGTGIAGNAHAGQVFEIATETLRRLDLSAAATGPYRNIAVFSPDGRSVALPCADQVVVAEVTEGGLADRFCHEFQAGTRVTAAVWSPDGGRVAVLTDAGVAVLTVGAEVTHLPCVPVPVKREWDFGDQQRVAFDRAGERVAVLADDPVGRTIEVWEVTGPRSICATPADPGTLGVAFADEDRTVVGFGPDVLEFLDATTGQRRNRQILPVEADTPGPPLDAPGESFLVSTGDAAVRPGRTSWRWVTAFDTGLVVCPPEARRAMASALSFVLDRRFAWPAKWAVGTQHLEVHDDWSTAIDSDRLPAKLQADDWSDWRERMAGTAQPRSVKRADGFHPVDPATLWRHGLPDGAVARVEAPTRHEPGCYVEDQIWPATQLTMPLLRSLLGKAVLIRTGTAPYHRPRLGAVLAVGREGRGRPDATIITTGTSTGQAMFGIPTIHTLATVRYLGHTLDDAE